MSEMNIGSADYGDMTNVITDYSVDSKTTDGANETGEVGWVNRDWGKQLGYYKKIPELRTAIDAKARWTIGEGINSEDEEKQIWGVFRGFGKDTFNTVLENQHRTMNIGGDSFAEIIRTSWYKRAWNKLRGDNGLMINLKPLDPSTIKTIANDKGIIIRYEQTSKIKGQAVKKFQPDGIFHLTRNRTADEIHGISLVEAVEDIILMRNEAMQDMKQLLHRYVKPRIIFQLDTDVASEITTYKEKMDKACEYGENIYVPMGAVTHELLSVPTNATLNPLPWIDRLNQYFFQATGVPQIIVGGSTEMTESTAKIAYVAFGRLIKEEQLYLQEQILLQLGLDVNFKLPVIVENELISDERKDGQMQALEPEDQKMTGEMQGVTG